MKKSKIFERIDANTPEHVKKKVSEQFEIAKKIGDILEKQGKSQRDFAELMEKKESEISKWLSGSHNFTIATLSSIQEKLGERVWDITPLSRREYLRQRLREQYKNRRELDMVVCVNLYETEGSRTQRQLTGLCRKVDIQNIALRLFPSRTKKTFKEMGRGFSLKVQVAKSPVRQSNKYVHISMDHGKGI